MGIYLHYALSHICSQAGYTVPSCRGLSRSHSFHPLSSINCPLRSLPVWPPHPALYWIILSSYFFSFFPLPNSYSDNPLPSFASTYTSLYLPLCSIHHPPSLSAPLTPSIHLSSSQMVIEACQSKLIQGSHRHHDLLLSRLVSCRHVEGWGGKKREREGNIGGWLAKGRKREEEGQS